MLLVPVLRYDGTQVTGGCPSSKRDIEQQQSDALRLSVSRLLNNGPLDWPPADELSRLFDRPLSELWASEDGKEEGIVGTFDWRGYARQIMRVIDGIAYSTSLDAQGAGLDLSVLPQLVSQLPRLEQVQFLRCFYNIQPEDFSAMQLPATLAAQAPRTMKTLRLEGSGVTGPLPDEWGTWATLVTLSLFENAITGTLPESWIGMSSLTTLDLRNNPSLTGTIPTAWITLQAGIFLQATNIGGCIPDQLMENIIWDKPYSPCSQSSHELSLLLELRHLLDPSERFLANWTAGSGPMQKPGD